MLILHNANIFTEDSFENPFKALAVDRGMIKAIGRDDEILSIAERNTKVLDLQGKYVLPGLCDAHIHLAQLSTSLSKVNCETKTVRECFNRLKDKADRTPSGEWILGHGWNQNDWDEGFSGMEILHSVSDQHPVFITAKSLHAAWGNKLAFKLANIDKNTHDPKDGAIGRNLDGEPNGLLFEHATLMLDNVIPDTTEGKLIDLLKTTQRELWKKGITSVHDFDRRTCFSALQNMDHSGTLRLRVSKSIPIENLEQAIDLGLRSGFGSDFLRIGPVKLFADGALGPQTAAMIKGYEDNSQKIGMLLLNRDELFEIGKKATRAGFPLAIHAIGDRTNHEVLDAYENIRQFEAQHHLLPQKHRIEHVQLLDPEDIKRLSQLNVIASMQPIHLITDRNTADRLWGSRSHYAYAFKSLIDHGTQLIFGSDAPVESFNPWQGMSAALTRSDDQSDRPDPWYPDQKISILDILKSYTINSAKSINWHEIGSLGMNKAADLIILNENPIRMETSRIKNIQPEATMVAGEWVWQMEEF